MKKNVSINSIETFHELSPVITRTAKAKILNALKQMGALSYSDIVKITRLKIPTVVARINELMYDHQLICVTYVRDNKNYYRIRRYDEPFNVKKLTTFERLEKLIDECEKNGQIFVPVSELKLILQQTVRVLPKAAF